MFLLILKTERERERKKERERERNIDRLPLECPPIGMCADQNQTHSISVQWAVLQPTEPLSQGVCVLFKKT